MKGNQSTQFSKFSIEIRTNLHLQSPINLQLPHAELIAEVTLNLSPRSLFFILQDGRITSTVSRDVHREKMPHSFAVKWGSHEAREKRADARQRSFQARPISSMKATDVGCLSLQKRTWR
ncbi:MAG: hypothetical protein U0X87_09425 [Anaerolineales bacterium]